MLFFENLLICFEGIGLAYCSDSFLPADPLSRSQNIDGLFELTPVPFMVPWPRLVRSSPELQRYKDIVRHALARPGGSTDRRATHAKLYCLFVQKHFSSLILDCGNPIELNVIGDQTWFDRWHVSSWHTTDGTSAGPRGKRRNHSLQRPHGVRQIHQRVHRDRNHWARIQFR